MHHLQEKIHKSRLLHLCYGYYECYGFKKGSVTLPFKSGWIA